MVTSINGVQMEAEGFEVVHSQCRLGASEQQKMASRRPETNARTPVLRGYLHTKTLYERARPILMRRGM